jgi:5-(carboxyamino)imidazole ribonucleotide mutase
MNQKKIDIAVVLGSDSDLPIAEKVKKILEDFNVPCAYTIRSAHRTPLDTKKKIKEFEERGCKIFIAIAGMAAHLAGIIASYTTMPVIGVPCSNAKSNTAINGLDALLSMVQMPEGVPVATVAIDNGANAALLAIQMLAISDIDLTEKLIVYKMGLEEKTLEKANKLTEADWPD